MMLGDPDSYMQKKKERKKEKKKLHHQYTLYTEINSRWINNLNISCDTIKVLQGNIGRT